MFKSILLYTNKLKLMKRFYVNILELDVIESEEEQFSVNIGTSTVSFKQSDTPSFYHLTLNIPGNQFFIMKLWIQERLALNQEGGISEIHYPNFDSDSIYFDDPAGNIVELIGRRSRDQFGDLTSAAFLNIGEISITTPFVADVGEQLQDFGIPLFQKTEIKPTSINFLGKGDSFIVLVPPKRRWMFSKRTAETHPLQITLTDNREIHVDKSGQIQLIEAV